MKIITIIVRVLFGALLTFSSVAYFIKLFPQPELTGNLKTFNEGINAAIYLMPLIKATELIAGISFLTNRFVALFTAIIFPISINIFLVHCYLDPRTLPIAIFVLLANLFLAYMHKDKYKTMLSVK